MIGCEELSRPCFYLSLWRTLLIIFCRIGKAHADFVEDLALDGSPAYGADVSSDTLPRRLSSAGAMYYFETNGTCPNGTAVTTPSDCRAAADTLNVTFTGAPVEVNQNFNPPNCHIYTGTGALNFNLMASSPEPCSSYMQCICGSASNTAAATTPAPTPPPSGPAALSTTQQAAATTPAPTPQPSGPAALSTTQQAAAPTPPPSNQPQFLNGNFESVDLDNPNGLAGWDPPAQGVLGIQVQSGTQPALFMTAPQGSYFAALQGAATGIRQTVANHQASTPYALQFAVAKVGADTQFSIWINGQEQQGVQTASPGNFINLNIGYTAPQSDVEIAFVNGGPSDGLSRIIFLDDIQIQTIDPIVFPGGPPPLSPATTTSTTKGGADPGAAAPATITSELNQLDVTVVDSLANSNLTYNSVTTATGATIVAQKLSPQAVSSDGGSDGSLLVPVQEQGVNTMNITLPASLINQVSDEAVLVATTLDPSLLQSVLGPTDGVYEVLRLNIVIRDANGVDYQSIQNLAEPIEISFAVGGTEPMECAWWDEAGQRWSQDGLQTVQWSPDGTLTCATSHLTIFSAVLQGFLSTLMCSQASLMTKEGYSMIPRGTWYKDTACILVWIWFGVLLSLLVLAAGVDRKRFLKDPWRDEFFLIPVDEDEGEDVDGQAPDHVGRSGVVWCGAMLDAMGGPMRDAVDDIMSNVFSYFGDVRNLLEEAYGLVREVMSQAPETGGSQAGQLAQIFLYSVLLYNNQRQASASLGVHPDDISFVLGDETEEELQKNCAVPGGQVQSTESRPEPEGDDSDAAIGSATSNQPKDDARVGSLVTQASSSTMRAMPSGAQARVRYLQRTRDAAEATSDRHELAHATWLSIPCMVVRSWVIHGPVGNIFVRSIFISSLMRAMFFACDVTGALLIMTIFFSSTGGAKSKTNRADCDIERNVWANIGRLLAIALLSTVLSGLPLSIISSLHSREFKRIDAKDSPAWERQMRAWRCQDRLVWILGLLYIGFCIHFILLFFANVSSADILQWVTCAGCAFLEDLILVPFALAMAYPVVAMFMLAVLSCMNRVSKREMIIKSKEKHQSIRGSAKACEAKVQDDETVFEI